MATTTKSKLKGGTHSIKALKASLKRGSGKGFLTRVPDGGSLTVRFLTEPTEWQETFLHYDANREPRNFPCTEDCEWCADGGEKPTRRYLANVLLTEEAKVVPLEMAITLTNQVMKKYERYKTLLDRDYDLTREGTGYDTEYDANPETPRKMNLARYDLIDLEDLLQGLLDTSEADDEDEEDEDEDEAPAKTRVGGRARPIKKALPKKVVPIKKVMHKKIIKKPLHKAVAKKAVPVRTLPVRTAHKKVVPMRRNRTK